MADIARKLQANYSEKFRYSNFGSGLRKVHIDGFRGIYSIDFELDFPITVVSGLWIKKLDLLKTVAIHDIGDADAVRVLNKTGNKAIAVREADIGSAPQEKLYSFPGNEPPEKEVFKHLGVNPYSRPSLI